MKGKEALFKTCLLFPLFLLLIPPAARDQRLVAPKDKNCEPAALHTPRNSVQCTVIAYI